MEPLEPARLATDPPNNHGSVPYHLYLPGYTTAQWQSNLIWVCSWSTQDVTNEGLEKGTYESSWRRWSVRCLGHQVRKGEKSEKGHLARSETASHIISSHLSRAIMMESGGQVHSR